MTRIGQFGFRLSWLLALPLAGCLATGSAAAADDEAKLKKAEAAEKHQHTKQVQVTLGDDEASCGDGQIVLKVIDDDGQKKIIRKRIKAGKRGFLGVHLVGLTPELKKHYTGDAKVGVLIGKLENDSPASKAGIEVGDVLVSVDGKPVDSALEIGELIGGRKKGDKVKIGVVRKGQKKELVATLDEHERAMKHIGHKMIWVGDKGDVNIDIDLEDLGEEIGDAVEEEVVQKLGDPLLKKKILIFKKQEEAEKKMEEKLRKMEERLKQLEEKLQGRLQKKLGVRSAKTT